MRSFFVGCRECELILVGTLHRFFDLPVRCRIRLESLQALNLVRLGQLDWHFHFRNLDVSGFVYLSSRISKIYHSSSIPLFFLSDAAVCSASKEEDSGARRELFTNKFQFAKKLYFCKVINNYVLGIVETDKQNWREEQNFGNAMDSCYWRIWYFFSSKERISFLTARSLWTRHDSEHFDRRRHRRFLGNLSAEITFCQAVWFWVCVSSRWSISIVLNLRDASVNSRRPCEKSYFPLLV